MRIVRKKCYNESEEAQNVSRSSLRRSDRICTQTGEWWKTKKSLLSYEFFVQEALASYNLAMSLENATFLQPGIEREHDHLIRNRI